MSYRIRHIDKQGATEDIPLLSRSERAWLFAERHRGAVIIGILIASLVAVILGTMLGFQHQHAQEASNLADQASRVYFDQPGDDAEAAQAQLETAERLYRQLLEEFPRTPSAQLSWYLLGNVLAAQQDYAGAIDAYQNFINQEDAHPVLLGFVYQRLGAAHLANGEREKGIQAYTQVLQAPNALNKDQVLFELATLEKHAQRNDQALAHYKSLIENHPSSPFASEAALQVRILDPSYEAAPGGDTEQGETQEKNTDEP